MVSVNDILMNKLKATKSSTFAVYQGYNSFFEVPVYKVVPYEGMGLDLPITFVGEGNGDVKGQAYLLLRQGLPDKASAEAFVKEQKAKLTSK